MIKFFVIFLAPFLLGAVTILGFSPYNFTFINFFSFSILLFLIFKYSINHKGLAHGTKEIQDIYPELGKQKNFPLVGKLIKGDSCSKNIIFKYSNEKFVCDYKNNDCLKIYE